MSAAVCLALSIKVFVLVFGSSTQISKALISMVSAPTLSAYNSKYSIGVSNIPRVKAGSDGLWLTKSNNHLNSPFVRFLMGRFSL